MALGVIDQKHDSHYLFEATPDIGQQLHDLVQAGGTSQLGGVFNPCPYWALQWFDVFRKGSLGREKYPGVQLPKNEGIP